MRKLRLFFLLYFCLFFINGRANFQSRQGFDPQRFQVDMERFITCEAGLSPQEAAIFFPLFRQMQNKQRAIFGEMRRYRHIDTRDQEASRKAIKKMDELDIDMKKLQKEYHEKFLDILPAGKVLDIIKAEEHFHRQTFRRMVRKDSMGHP